MDSLLLREILAGTLHFTFAVAATVHILLTKHNVRAAIGWTGLVWLAPFFGPLFYLLFGINRIRRTAGRIREDRHHHTAAWHAAVVRGQPGGESPGESRGQPNGQHAVAPNEAEPPPGWEGLAKLTSRVSAEPLVRGNAIEPLVDGDEGYPAMLEAIRAARYSVGFATYIFDRGQVASAFVEALADAVERGVQVRVMIDALGARYSRPSMTRELRRRGIPVALFLKSRLPLPNPYSNLRNHRKLLIVDGSTAFTGGLNVRDQCVIATSPPELATRDMHFRLRGPIVEQIQRAFVFDWHFCTHEELVGDDWFPQLQVSGPVLARGIADGPDETKGVLPIALQGALAQARDRVRIVTPYFLPDPGLIDALNVAAMRGVAVEIYLPSRGNLRLVQWAQTAQLDHVLRGGCRVFLTGRPFDHSKLMTVDGGWSLIGSANWDPRSLRLNFEHVVECYCSEFASRLDALIDDKARGSTELSRKTLAARPLWMRLRDSAVWLAQPYL